MSYYELFEQGPAIYIPYLIFSLFITVLAYGIFPFVFANSRKTPITKKKYKRLCYGINFAVMIIFIAINGGASNGAPYFLWTWVASNYGVKILREDRRLIDDFPMQSEEGNSTPSEPIVPDTDDALNTDNMTPDETLDVILDWQAKRTIEIMEVNRESQPDNEGDVDFGLVPEKPIFTLALMSVDGERKYLNKLYTANGEKITYERQGSMSVDGINGMIDIYNTYLPSGQPYKTLYINMYGARTSTQAPEGFVLNEAAIQNCPPPKKEKPAKTKYCSRCGTLIDNETKICTGCGKKYFKGLRFNKFSVTVIISSVLIIGLSILNIAQYQNNNQLQQDVKNLKSRLNYKEIEISDLEYEISELEYEKRKNRDKLNFYNRSVVIVGDDGTDVYHKYGCSRLDISNGCWIMNPEAADYSDYTRCSLCND